MIIMASLNLEIKDWVGVLNYDCETDNASADLKWYNGYVTRIIKKTDEYIKVNLHFRPDDKDNKVDHCLCLEDMVKTLDVDITSDTIVKNCSKTQLAWRRYAANPDNYSQQIRALTNGEIIEILKNGYAEKFAKLCDLESDASSLELVSILQNIEKNFRSIPKKFKKPASLAAVAAPVAAGGRKRRGESSSIDLANNKRVEPVPAAVPVPEQVIVPGMVSALEFKQYRNDMNARLNILEQSMTTLRRTVEGLDKNRNQAVANVAVAVRNVVNERKESSSPKSF